MNATLLGKMVNHTVPPDIGMKSLAATADSTLGNSSNDLFKVKIRNSFSTQINGFIVVIFTVASVKKLMCFERGS